MQQAIRQEGKDQDILQCSSLENTILLDEDAPSVLKKACTSYQAMATKHSKWKLDDIAGTVFDLAHHIHNRE